jgi:para-aminobenzoate synthetase component I
MLYNHKEGIIELNRLGAERIPFLFILSFDKKQIFISPLDELDDDIFYKVNTMRNFDPKPLTKKYDFKTCPIPYLRYKKSFEAILEEIRSGNTYLLNLTFQTPIETDLNLYEIFAGAKAKYKLYFKDQFICYSPEKFIEIEDETISTYPMKGTIDASLEDAQKKILEDKKELAEHTMIVDLMRNDLGIIANDIQVKHFRYIDTITAGEKKLLQVSSHIEGHLEINWQERIGEILDKLTPAGSISGTPKRSTLNIIKKTEDYRRGFYTGVFGIFEGNSLHSGVMIRFIEKLGDTLAYKSGGGITIDSDLKSEYEELNQKIYLPF